MSTPSVPLPKPWTVLIFMVVDEDSLAPYALIDLRDVRRLGNVTTLNVVTEIRWHNCAPERYDLQDGDLHLLPTPPLGADASRLAVLTGFLLDALRSHPAEHYMLMLWGHAYGFGFGRPESERLVFQDLAELLAEFARARGHDKLEILACNSCRIGKVETVYELQQTVKYLVASQVGVPYEGWPLRSVLSELVKSPTMPPAELASVMVTRYCDAYRERTISMTMLNLEESAGLLERLKTLAGAMFSELDDQEELRNMHEAFVRAANNEEETEPVVDLYELCSRIAELTHNSGIRSAATAILDLLGTPTFIAMHDGTGPGSDRLHGIGLFVPHVSLDVNCQVYEKLGLAQARMWTRILERLQITGKHAPVLEAITTLEQETLRKAELSSDAALAE